VSGQLYALSALLLGKEPEVPIWIGGWGDPKACLEDVEKKQFFTLPGFELWPVVSRCTDYANEAIVEEEKVKKGKFFPVLNYLSTLPWRYMGKWRYSSTILDLGTWPPPLGAEWLILVAPIVFLTTPFYWPCRKHLSPKQLYCSVCIYCPGNVFTGPLPRNGRCLFAYLAVIARCTRYDTNLACCLLLLIFFLFCVWCVKWRRYVRSKRRAMSTLRGVTVQKALLLGLT
jgi:hypothetical protein